MIDLSKSIPFAEGGRRICFLHPDDCNLCIKIAKQDQILKRRAKAPLYRRLRPLSAFDDNMDEIKGYRQIVVRRAINDKASPLWQHIPHCYGFIDTNLGPGLVSDYYQVNGKTAPTVEKILFTEGLTSQLEKALQQFATFLHESLLVTRAILPHNLVIAADGRVKLIDGIGGRNFIPIAETFPFPHYNFIAKQKAKKRVNEMWARVEADLKRASAQN